MELLVLYHFTQAERDPLLPTDPNSDALSECLVLHLNNYLKSTKLFKEHKNKKFNSVNSN